MPCKYQNKLAYIETSPFTCRLAEPSMSQLLRIIGGFAAWLINLNYSIYHYLHALKRTGLNLIQIKLVEKIGCVKYLMRNKDSIIMEQRSIMYMPIKMQTMVLLLVELVDMLFVKKINRHLKGWKIFHMRLGWLPC